MRERPYSVARSMSFYVQKRKTQKPVPDNLIHVDFINKKRV